MRNFYLCLRYDIGTTHIEEVRSIFISSTRYENHLFHPARGHHWFLNSSPYDMMKQLKVKR